MNSGARSGRGSCGGSILLVAAGLFFLLPIRRAEAHTPIKGMGEFVSGFLHPFLTPTHVLVLLSLGLLLGQRQPLRLGRPMGVFAAFAAVGLLVTTIRPITGLPQPILIAAGLVIGGFVALVLPLPPPVRLVACAAAGLALGLDSGVDPGTTGLAAAKTLLATWVGLLIGVGDVAFYCSRLPPARWAQTGVRIIGSWIVAIAFLMLAFALRRGGPSAP